MYISTISACQVANSQSVGIGNIGVDVEFAMVRDNRNRRSPSTCYKIINLYINNYTKIHGATKNNFSASYNSRGCRC